MTQPCRAIATNTPLPPGIRGRVLGHLTLQVSLFRWTGVHPLTGVKVNAAAKAPIPQLSVRVVWWGEQGTGVQFRPRIAQRSGHKQGTTRTTAKYQVCVPAHKLHAYLSDMKSLYLDVVEDSNGLIVGRARLENLPTLAKDREIQSVVVVAGADGIKFGELTVSLKLESCAMPASVSAENVMATASHVPDQLHQKPIQLQPLKSSKIPVIRLPKVAKRNEASRTPDQQIPKLKSALKGASSSPAFLAQHYLTPVISVTQHTPTSSTAATVNVEIESVLSGGENPECFLPQGASVGPPVQSKPPTLEPAPPQSPDGCKGDLSQQVLSRIQSALEESRRLREQVCRSELDAETVGAYTMAATATHTPPPTKADWRPDDLSSDDLFASARSEVTIQQTASPLRPQIDDFTNNASNDESSCRFDFDPATLVDPDTLIATIAENMDQYHAKHLYLGDASHCCIDNDEFEDDDVCVFAPSTDSDLESIIETALNREILYDDDAEEFHPDEQVSRDTNESNGGGGGDPAVADEGIATTSNTRELESVPFPPPKRLLTIVPPRNIRPAPPLPIRHPKSANSSHETNKLASQDHPGLFLIRGLPIGVRLGFRRVSFPANVWSALSLALMENFYTKNIQFPPESAANQTHGVVVRPRPIFKSVAPGNKTLVTRRPGTTNAMGGARSPISTQKRVVISNAQKTNPPQLVITKTLIAAAIANWDFELDLLVPTDLVDEAVNPQDGFCPLETDDLWWLQRFPLCRSTPSGPHGKTISLATITAAAATAAKFTTEVDKSVIFTPSKPSGADPLILAPQSHTLHVGCPIKIKLYCRPASGEQLGYSAEQSIPDEPKKMFIGSVELPYTALLAALHQPPGSSAPSGAFNETPTTSTTKVTPKTLRVRMEFVSTLAQRIYGVLNSVNAQSTELSVHQCFVFINVEPVWPQRDCESAFPANSTSCPVHVATSTHPETVERVTTKEEEVTFGGAERTKVIVASPVEVVRCPSPLFLGPPGSPLHLEVLLNVCEAKALKVPPEKGQAVLHTYLVVRTPWCTEESLRGCTNSPAVAAMSVPKAKRFQSAVAWSSGSNPAYYFGLRTSGIFTEEMMSRLQMAFVAVEVWTRQTGGKGAKDEMIGLAKVKTLGLSATYQSRTGNPANAVSTHAATVGALLTSRLPAVQEEAWIPVTSPSTGQVNGHLHTRLSVGTAAQISALLEAERSSRRPASEGPGGPTPVDWKCIDFVRWPLPIPGRGCCLSSVSLENGNDCSSSSFTEENVHVSVNHTLDIGVCSLTDFVPSLSETLTKEFGGAFPTNDSDCFIQYTLRQDCDTPSVLRTPLRALQHSTSLINQQATEQHDTSVNCQWFLVSPANGTNNAEKPTRDVEIHEGPLREEFWHRTHSHTFTQQATNMACLTKNASYLDSRAFLFWLGQASGIPFELWVRVYSPLLREVLVARGLLPWSLLAHTLMPPPITSSSVQGLDDEWRRFLNQHPLALFDVSSGQLVARAEVNLSYRCKTTIRRTSDNDDCPNGLFCRCCGATNVIRPSATRSSSPGHNTTLTSSHAFTPSTARTGVHLHVHLLALTGLGACGTAEGEPVHVRVHCLLLLPPEPACSQTDKLHHTPSPKLLATAVYQDLQKPTFSNQIDTRLDVLLPLSWIDTKSSGIKDTNRRLASEYTAAAAAATTTTTPPSLDTTTVDNHCVAFTLAEVLAQGSLELESAEADRQAWVAGRVSKPCLVVQVDVWSECLSSESKQLEAPGEMPELCENSLGRTRLWDLNYRDRGGDLHPSLPSRLLASCRVALSDVLQTGGSMSPRWVALLQTTTGLPQASCPFPARVCRLGGAVEISATFAAPTARRRVLDEAVSLADTSRLDVLRRLGIRLPLDSTGRAEASSCLGDSKHHGITNETLWEDGFDEAKFAYKQFTLRFTAACLPTEESLLEPAELAACRQLGLQGSFFARASFFDSNFQFEDTLQFCTPVGPRLRNYLIRTVLEVQIWAQWMSKKDLSACHSSCATSSMVTSASDSLRPSSGEQLRVPPPRFLGSLQMPLSRFLYMDCATGRQTASTHKQGVGNFYWTFGSSKGCLGQPGEVWPGSIKRSSRDPLPVFPLYRHSTEDLRDAWVAASIEMTSRKSLSTPVPVTDSPLTETKQQLSLLLGNRRSGILAWLPNSDVSQQWFYKQASLLPSPPKEANRESNTLNFPAYVVIERANRLLSIQTHLTADEKVQIPPKLETFATFLVPYTDNSGFTNNTTFCRGECDVQRVAVTSISNEATSPVWNYQRYSCLPMSLISPDSRGLVIDVWQRRHDDDPKPHHLGSACADLSSLVLPSSPNKGGLEYVYGWYEISSPPSSSSSSAQDRRSRGQILLGVYPVAPGDEMGGGRRLSPRLEKLMTSAPNRAPSPPSISAMPPGVTPVQHTVKEAQTDPSSTVCESPLQRMQDLLIRRRNGTSTGGGDETPVPPSSPGLVPSPTPPPPPSSSKHPVPAVTISPPTLDRESSPLPLASRPLFGLPTYATSSMASHHKQQSLGSSISALLSTLQSQLCELDVQNARLKRKLSEDDAFDRPPPEVVQHWGQTVEQPPDRPGKGTLRPGASGGVCAVCHVPATYTAAKANHSGGIEDGCRSGHGAAKPAPISRSLESDPDVPRANQAPPSPTMCRYCCYGTGDNNSKVETESSASSTTSQWEQSLSEMDGGVSEEDVNEEVIFAEESVDEVSLLPNDDRYSPCEDEGIRAGVENRHQYCHLGVEVIPPTSSSLSHPEDGPSSPSRPEHDSWLPDTNSRDDDGGVGYQTRLEKEEVGAEGEEGNYDGERGPSPDNIEEMEAHLYIPDAHDHLNAVHRCLITSGTVSQDLLAEREQTRCKAHISCSAEASRMTKRKPPPSVPTPPDDETYKVDCPRRLLWPKKYEVNDSSCSGGGESETVDVEPRQKVVTGTARGKGDRRRLSSNRSTKMPRRCPCSPDMSSSSSSSSSSSRYFVRLRGAANGAVQQRSFLFRNADNQCETREVLPDEDRLVIREEEAETITSVSNEECALKPVVRMTKRISLGQRFPHSQKGSNHHRPFILFDDATEATLANDDDTFTSSSKISSSFQASPPASPPTMLQIASAASKSPSRCMELQQANLAVPHSHLQALKFAREAAENVKLRDKQPQPARLESIEDPMRQRIHQNLSSLVRKTNLVICERLQPSSRTVSSILNGADASPPVDGVTTGCHDNARRPTQLASTQPLPSAAPPKLSSRSLVRAARIFDMKL